MRTSTKMFRLALIVALAAYGCTDSQTARIASTSTEPCRGCTLTLDSIATVGQGQGEGESFVRPSFGAVIRNGHLLVSATVPVQVFDLSGRFVRTLGRQGQGPGEFATWISGMSPGPGGTVHVFLAQQAVVFDSSLRFIRRTAFTRDSHRPTALTDGRYAGLFRIPPRGRLTESLYLTPVDTPLFHMFDSAGAYVWSVGSSLSLADEIIAPGAAGTIWTGKRAPYEVKQWSPDGALLRVIARETPYFDRSPYRGPWPYIRGEGPRPQLLLVRQDSRGLLWVAARIVKPNWAEAIRAGDQLCCESIVEVLDPVTGSLIASARIPLHVQTLIDDDHIAGVSEGPNGEPLLVLYRARLTIPGRVINGRG